jgi:hypothetical protein
MSLKKRRRWNGLFAGLLAAGVCWGGAGIAYAQDTTVAVLGLGSEDGDDGLATAITRAVRSEAEAHDGYEVSSSHVSLAQMTMAQDCEISDAQCRIAVASALKSERVIYGSLIRANRRTYELELHMADGRDGTETRASRTFSSRDTSDATFARLARELLAELRGESPAAAEPAPAPAQAIRPLPDDERAEARTGAEAVPPADDDEPSSNDWLGYTLVGVAVVGAAMTAFSWMQIDKAEQDPALKAYRGAVDPNQIDDACDEAQRGNTHGLSTGVVDDARAACRQGRTFEVLQYVFLGAALASAGAGTYFLLDDESDGETAARRRSLAVIPRVSPSSGSVDLRFRF